jgi:hypothetical protein
MRPMSMNIRIVLEKYPDGLTVPQIGKVLKKRPSLVRQSIQTMPDAYIDRWEAGASKWVSVWCLNPRPPHAPMPEYSITERK